MEKANWESVQNLSMLLDDIKNGIWYESITDVDAAFVALRKNYLKEEETVTRSWMTTLIKIELNKMIKCENEGIQRFCYLLSAVMCE